MHIRAAFAHPQNSASWRCASARARICGSSAHPAATSVCANAPGSHLLREARALRLLRAKHDDHFPFGQKNKSLSHVYPYVAPLSAVSSAMLSWMSGHGGADQARQMYADSPSSSVTMLQPGCRRSTPPAVWPKNSCKEAGLMHRIAHLSHACGQMAHERMIAFLHQHRRWIIGRRDWRGHAGQTHSAHHGTTKDHPPSR